MHYLERCQHLFINLVRVIDRVVRSPDARWAELVARRPAPGTHHPTRRRLCPVHRQYFERKLSAPLVNGSAAGKWCPGPPGYGTFLHRQLPAGKWTRITQHMFGFLWKVYLGADKLCLHIVVWLWNVEVFFFIDSFNSGHQYGVWNMVTWQCRRA